MSFMRLKVRLQEHKKIFPYIKAYGEKIFKPFFINFPPTKDNGINVFPSDVQNHAPYTGPHKKFLKHYYGLCLETAGNTF